MRRLLGRAALLGLALVASFTASAQPLPPGGGQRSDFNGDPLPEGAVARLGRYSAYFWLQHVDSLAFSPDGRVAATAFQDGSVRTWLSATGQPLRNLVPPPGRPACSTVVISPDGSSLAAGTQASGRVSVWQAGTGKLRLARVPEGLGRVLALAFRPDGGLLVGGTSGSGKSLQLWELYAARKLLELEAPHGLQALALSADGRYLAWARQGEAAGLWDIGMGKALGSLGDDLETSCLVFSPDGRLVAAAGRAVRLWSRAGGRPRAVLSRGLPGRLMATSLAVSGDGRMVAAGNALGDVHCWEVATGKELVRRAGYGPVSCLAFSPDGRLLAAGMADQTALVWDLSPEGWDAGARDPPAPAAQLASDDARAAYEAVWRLAAGGDQGALLLEALLRLPAAAPEQVERWIAELDHPRFEVRTRATLRLRELGFQVAPALRKVLEGGPSPEVKMRVEALLAALEPPFTSYPSEPLRRRRAIWALEKNGGAHARKVLDQLSRTSPSEVERQDAAEALARLIGGLGGR